jgi:hypothetical protein
MNSSLLPLLVLLVYLGIGVYLSTSFIQKGATGGALATLVAWPLMLGAWSQYSAGTGPFTVRIQQAFRALEAAWQDPGAKGVLPELELKSLEQSLIRADSRIGMVDRLLEDPAVAEGGAPLREARARAAREVEQALQELVLLRVQLGLVALAGDTRPVQSSLANLSARVRALEEMGLS